MAKTADRALDPDQDYRSAMRALIAPRWEAVWESVPVALAGEDPEGVHDVRVASRRVRAAMDVATECFPAAWFGPLHQTAKAITAALGDVRDRDVLIAALAAKRARAKVVERPGIDHLIARLEGERDEARRTMVGFLTSLDAQGVPEETRRRFPLPSAPDTPEVAKAGAKRGGATSRKTGRVPAKRRRQTKEAAS
ncbi:MAG: CHAD domain-containing protein [Chloroflexia bacterium]|nr:CHAD domain-containing protein [Chloroflexia bacterium]